MFCASFQVPVAVAFAEPPSVAEGAEAAAMVAAAAAEVEPPAAKRARPG
jgi:hypothetical protein